MQCARAAGLTLDDQDPMPHQRRYDAIAKDASTDAHRFAAAQTGAEVPFVRQGLGPVGPAFDTTYANGTQAVAHGDSVDGAATQDVAPSVQLQSWTVSEASAVRRPGTTEWTAHRSSANP
jgi:hypothetical protein